MLGALGAGDVKLLAAIGAMKGPEFVLAVAVYGSLVGGLLAVLYVVKERRVKSTARYFAYGWLGALRGARGTAGSIPYAPAIAAGAAIALIAPSWLSA
jgi:prepilin peptidase CpaA